MSTFLHRVGRYAFVRPWAVLGAWLALIVVVAGLLAVNPHKISSEMRINGTPTQGVIDQPAAEMPERPAASSRVQHRLPPPDDSPAPLIVDGQPVPVAAAMQAVANTDLEVLPSAAMAQVPEIVGAGEVIALVALSMRSRPHWSAISVTTPDPLAEVRDVDLGVTGIKQIGFALAFGVFVDAFIVRMAMVPAVMSQAQPRAARIGGITRASWVITLPVKEWPSPGSCEHHRCGSTSDASRSSV